MDRLRNHNRYRRWNCLLLALYFAAQWLFVATSCTTPKCVLCNSDRNVLYQVEMKAGTPNVNGKNILKTFFAPVPMEMGNKKVDLYVVDCEGKEPYKMQQPELEDFIKRNIYKIDTSYVERIVTTSDADFPPSVVTFTQLDSFKLCNRFRKPLKVEVRAMTGVRNFDRTGTYFPGYNGGIFYPKKVLGFGEGGTNVVVGAEAALLPRIQNVGSRNAFNLGVMTGFWPVDAGMFIPIALHPRFTFNEFSAPLWGSCNAYYLFADLGTAFDASGDVPLWANKKLTSWFWDVGAGIDLWQSKNHDLSIDAGYRQTHFSMPFNADYQQCLHEAGLEHVSGYPARMAGQIFIRLGFTW